MKTYTKILVKAMLWLLLAACQREDHLFNGDSTATGLRVNLGIDIAVQHTDSRTSSVVTDDFRIDLYRSDGSEIAFYDRYAEMPDTLILEPGTYYASATSGRLLPGGFDCPYFSGYSDSVSLGSGEIKNLSILCSLGNCKVAVIYSQNIISMFDDYSTTISNSDTSILFTKGENRSAYFALKPMSIVCQLQYGKPDGTTGEKILQGTIDEPEKQKYYEIHMDAQISDPAAIVGLEVDESLTTRIINLNDGGLSPGPDEIAYGNLVISEIMYDPDSLLDTQGEWFELYNSSADTIDLFHLVLKRGTTNMHVIDEHILLPPLEYFTLVRTEQACNVDRKYVYGSSFSLPNTGDDLLISNYGTDGTNGNIIAEVNYGLAGFPDGLGASICLDPMHLNADDALSGTNWCVSTSEYNTTDLGTPGKINDSCN